MNLIDFHGISTDDLMREIERMKHDRIVRCYPSQLSTPANAGAITNPLTCTKPAEAGIQSEELNA